MTARAHRTATPQRSLTGRADDRLPWWALVLPAVAFCALLLLLVTGGEAEAAEGGRSLAGLLERIEQALSL